MQGVYVRIFSTVRSIPFTGQSQSSSQARGRERDSGPRHEIEIGRYKLPVRGGDSDQVFIRYLMNACLHEYNIPYSNFENLVRMSSVPAP